MIDVDRDADALAQLVAQVVGVRQRVDARAVGGVHRMQRLDRQRHARRARVFEQLADAVAHHLARAAEVLANDAAVAVLGQAADDQHQAGRPQRQRLVDGALVVVERSASAGAVGRREHAAAAVAR